MEVLFVTGFSPIVADPATSREFYAGALDLPLDHEEGDYVFTETLPGVKHFGLWPLSQAAQSCFRVGALAGGARRAASHRRVRGARRRRSRRGTPGEGLHADALGEDRALGSTIARLLSPEGLLVGLSHIPPHD